MHIVCIFNEREAFLQTLVVGNPIQTFVILNTMKQDSFLLLILLLSSTACKDNLANTKPYSLRDTVVKKYFAIADSTDQIDTTEESYKILKAYVLNDTASIKKLKADFIDFRKFDEEWSIYDSCIHQKKLQSLDIDTGYRFIYDRAFCPYKINATITKSGDSVKLNFILYQPNWDTAKCRIISEFNKSLTQKNWDDLMFAIRKCDFWGLKKLNGIQGVDGDGLTVIGYIKDNPRFPRPAQFKYVYRWGISSTSLEDPFHLLLKISGNKKGCIWIE